MVKFIPFRIIDLFISHFLSLHMQKKMNYEFNIVLIDFYLFINIDKFKSNKIKKYLQNK